MKRWYQQKTFWTNLTAVATAVASLFAPAEMQSEIQGAVLGIIGIGQIFMRQGVESNKTKKV